MPRTTTVSTSDRTPRFAARLAIAAGRGSLRADGVGTHPVAAVRLVRELEAELRPRVAPDRDVVARRKAAHLRAGGVAPHERRDERGVAREEVRSVLDALGLYVAV